MKTFKYFAALLAMIFGMSVGSQAQCVNGEPPDALSDCYDTDPQFPCGAENWVSAQRLIEYPGMPGCTVTVDYITRSCIVNGRTFTQTHICLYTPGPGCEALVALIEESDPNTKVHNLRDIKTIITQELLKQLFLEEYSQMTPEEQLAQRCPTDPTGQSGPDWSQVKYNYSILQGSCSSYCTSSSNSAFREVTCTPGFCCRVITQYCIDENGVFWSLITYDDNDRAPACPGETPSETCGSEWEQTTCISNCEND